MPDLTDMDSFFGPAEGTNELENVEQNINLNAKRDLFEPDIARSDWDAFCVAAEKEEAERKLYVPKGKSRISEKEQALLARGDTCRDEKCEALLEKREQLSRSVRPQCTDVDGAEEAEEVERLVNEEFGIEDWGSIDTSIGGGV